MHAFRVRNRKEKRIIWLAKEFEKKDDNSNKIRENRLNNFGWPIQKDKVRWKGEKMVESDPSYMQSELKVRKIEGVVSSEELVASPDD